MRRKKTKVSSVIRFVLFVVITSSLLYSCVATQVSSDYNRSVDFKGYKTFAWLPKTHAPKQDAAFDNQIVETNIKNLASGQLKSRGYKVNVDEPDLLIDFYIDVAKKVEHVTNPVYGYSYNYNGNYSNSYNNNLYSNNNSYYNNNSYINNNNMNMNMNNNMSYNMNNNMNNNMPTITGYTTQDIPYEEGTVTILVIDRKTKELIWKGWSVGSVTDESSFEYELPSDIHRLFKEEFPIPVLKSPTTKKVKSQRR